jgi:DNA-binding transcriptional LysR family regulator
VTEPRPMSDIRIDREWEEVLMAVAPVVDTDESIRSIALSVLAARPFVLFERRLAPPLYDKIFELCLAAGFTPRIAQETQSWQAALGLVAAGYGVSVMPASLGRLEFPGVRFRPLRDSPTITYGACVRPNDQRATVRNFVTMLGPQVANLSRGMLPRKPR